GTLFRLGGFEPPAPERLVDRVVRLDGLGRRRTEVELRQKTARLAGPRDREVLLCAGQADIEQTPLFGDCLNRLRELRRQLFLLEARQEDRFELEALRPVIRQEVHTAPRIAAEAFLELRDPVGHGARAELLGEPDEPRQVALARDLALAQ